MEFKPKAFLFDLNGTMIDDMTYHLQVWYDILNEDLKAGLTREEVKHQMYGKNHELLDRVFGKGKFSAEEVSNVSRKKEERYQEIYKAHLTLLPGLHELLVKAESKNIAMAIGSAAIPFNIDFVLDNLSIRKYFKTIVSADDVVESKPHPEVFLKAAAQLGVQPSSCIVFEDVPKGAEAAQNAGMKAVIITSTHEAAEFSSYSNILFFCQDYNDPRLLELIGA